MMTISGLKQLPCMHAKASLISSKLIMCIALYDVLLYYPVNHLAIARSQGVYCMVCSLGW